MRRRELIALFGGAIAWPFAVSAQSPSGKMLRVGVVGAQGRDAPIYIAFLKRMAELGYQEGRNFSFEYVRTPSIDDYEASFRELAARKPDIVMAVGNEPALRAARAIAGDLPIVVLAIDFDPVARGYVASMARPGGNITGMFVHALELAAKRIELLRAAFAAASAWSREAASQTRPSLRAAGNAARNSSMRFAASSSAWTNIPVMLPPGRAMLAT